MSESTWEDTQHRSLRLRWPATFEQRREHGYPSENDAWLDELRSPAAVPDDGESEDSESEVDVDVDGEDDDSFSIASTNQDGDDEQIPDDNDVMAILMRNLKEGCLDQADKIQGFCAGANIAHLEPRARRGTGGSLALLDERSIASARQRRYKGLLSPHQLYEELARLRLRTTQKEDEPEGQSDAYEPNAERRMIYISDADPLSFIALAARTSRTHAPALLASMYSYIARETKLQVKIPSVGFTTFALQLDIPHFVLREQKGLCQDNRKKPDGRTPLRQSERLDFLKSPSGRPYCLYEAQTSVVVTGIDHFVWSVYAFVDAYFDNRRSSSYHHRQSRNDVRFDPLGPGHLDLKYPLWTPREYFLKVSEIQLNLAKNEWHYVIRKLEEYVNSNRPIQLFSELSKPFSFGVSRRRIHQINVTVNQMTDLATRLDKTLSKQLSALDEFLKRDCWYFRDDCGANTDSSTLDTSLRGIERCHSDLRQLSDDIKALNRFITDSYPKTLETFLGLNGITVSNFMMFVSMITVILFPLVVSANLFSVQPTVMPWTQDFGTFLKTLGVSTSAVLGSLVFYFSWDWLCVLVGLIACKLRLELDGIRPQQAASLRNAGIEVPTKAETDAEEPGRGRRESGENPSESADWPSLPEKAVCVKVKLFDPERGF